MTQQSPDHVPADGDSGLPDSAILDIARTALDELKAESVEILDVAKLTTIADHMVVCSGGSSRHVKRIGETLIEQAKKAGLRPRVEGLAQAEWVLIDLNGVVVHVMQPATRAYYQIEKLWDLNAVDSSSKANQ